MPPPKQKPGNSKQDYQTDPLFIAAVQERFGPIAFDLAASPHNTQHRRYFSKQQDTLRQDWSVLTGNLWLNPEYADIAPYVRKCSETKRPRDPGRILVLTPAAVSTEWFAEHVHKKALVLAIRPRLTFVGEADPYIKDLMLMVYGSPPGFDCWKWRV